VKILMLHQHFNTPTTGGAIRSYYLAKALVDHGHQVAVITGGPGKETVSDVDGIEVCYLPIAYNNRFTFYARSRAFMQYVFGVIRISQRYRHFDVAYGISVPLTVGLCTLWMKYRHRMPYVFEVGDLWPDAPIQMGFINNRIFQALLFWLEKTIYKNADSIVALSPAIREAITKKIQGKKIDVISNMSDCDFYRLEKKNRNLEIKFQTVGRLVVSYVGAVGVANGLEYFLDCAAASKQAGLNVRFLVAGDGAMLDELKSAASSRGLDNTHFIGFLNRTGVRDVLNVTDAVFVCYKPVPILETGSPNKYFDGLAAGKLVITNFGGWIRREIESHGCGIYVNPALPDDFVQNAFPLLADEAVRTACQTKSRELAESKYSRKEIGSRFVRTFSKYG